MAFVITRRDVYDVVIIGSGAGGGPLAKRLSEHGLTVLVIEKGPKYLREQYAHDELLLTEQFSMFVPHPSDDPHILAREDGMSEITSLGWTASCVGGGTSHMGANLYRMRPADFRMRSIFGGTGPLADWPYSYEDLEPYYTQAEWEIGVAGDATTEPADAPRSQPYPLPPLQDHALAAALINAARALRVNLFHTPRGINSLPYMGRPQCTHCQLCTGFGCPTGARGSTQETLLRSAEQTGHCEVRPQCMAVKLLMGPSGLITGCLYIDAEGREQRVQSHLVCVCCSAIESARLLLLSGVANSSGLVGKNLQFMYFSGAYAFFDVQASTCSDSSLPFRSIGRSSMDFYNLPPEVEAGSRGGTIRFDLAHEGPIAKAQRLTRQEGSILWGRALKDKLHNCFRGATGIEFEAFHDFFPDSGTFVDLDPDITDKWRLPVARIHMKPTHHSDRVGPWLASRGLDILTEMKPASLSVPSTNLVNGHLIHGTCRAGHDPRTSVLNEFCQSHDVPNLFIVDGSFMPSTGGVPSTLTILANSFRVAAFLVDACNRGTLTKRAQNFY